MSGFGSTQFGSSIPAPCQQPSAGSSFSDFVGSPSSNPKHGKQRSKGGDDSSGSAWVGTDATAAAPSSGIGGGVSFATSQPARFY